MILIGEKIAPFVLPRASDGKLQAWPSSTASITVFSFCAFWCDTWQEQARRLDLVRQRTRGLPAVCWTVSTDGRWVERHKTSRFLRAGELLVDAGGRWGQEILGLRAVPHTLVLDRRGGVVASERGIVRTEIIVAVVARAASRS